MGHYLLPCTSAVRTATLINIYVYQAQDGVVWIDFKIRLERKINHPETRLSLCPELS